MHIIFLFFFFCKPRSEVKDSYFSALSSLCSQVESSLPTAPRPWDQYIESGKDTLRGQESNFHRPMIQRDKLFYTKPDGDVIQVDHPRPQGFTARHNREGQTQVRYMIFLTKLVTFISFYV